MRTTSPFLVSFLGALEGKHVLKASFFIKNLSLYVLDTLLFYPL